jgi:hypothetical protein
MMFNADLDALKREVDELRLQTEALRVEGNRFRNLLGCFDCEGYEVFRKEVLVPEMHRLERLRMDIPSDQIMVQERVVGQWAEVNALATQKETLAQELELNVVRTNEQNALLNRAEAKLNREIKKKTGE